MKKGVLLIFLFSSLYSQSIAQGKLDSLFSSKDTTAVLDSLMKDFDLFLDSIAAPKSFFNVSIGAGNGTFSFENKSTSLFVAKHKLIVSPSIGYFHRSGFGLSATAFVIQDSGRLNFYQYAFSPSYDVIRRSFSTGISYTHYIHKDSLNFYITPISHELFAYFSYKKWWVRPTVSVAYGWGSKTEYQKQELKRIGRLKQLLRVPRSITITNEESVSDLSVTVSLRKDFDWYDVISKNDNITFTPVVLLNSGTQKFGFNTSYMYSFSAIRANSLPGNQHISESTAFAAQSAGLVLRGSYLKGKFLLQSQVLFDYYIPDAPDRFNTVFTIMAGLNF